MCFRKGLLAGALFVALVHAQTAPQTQGEAFSSLQAEQANAQATAEHAKQIERDNLIANAETQANQSKQGLEARYRELGRELAKCSIDKGQADMAAKQTAGQATDAANQNALQTGMQGLSPLLQNGLNISGEGTKTADADIKSAVASQKSAQKHFNDLVECGNVATTLKDDGSNIKTVKAQVEEAANEQIFTTEHTATAATSTTPATANCPKLASRLRSVTIEAEQAIKDGQAAKSKMSQNMGSLVATAVTVGAALYGRSQALKSAASVLADALSVDAQNEGLCKSGIQGEADEIRIQLAAIDKQLAEDKARIMAQYADFGNAPGVTLPANSQLRSDIGSTDNSAGGSGSPGVSVAGTTLGGSNLDPFANLNKLGKVGGGAGAGGGGAAAQGGSPDSGKPGWGFPNPGDTANPGLAYSLPVQPATIGTVGGSDSGAGGGATPGDPGPGLFGFQDPFANVGNPGAELAKSSGNGFWELAMRTHRRVYAHLGELLGKRPLSPKIGSKDGNQVDRKITSVK